MLGSGCGGGGSTSPWLLLDNPERMRTPVSHISFVLSSQQLNLNNTRKVLVRLVSVLRHVSCPVLLALDTVVSNNI